MLYEFNGICCHCAEEVNILIHNGNITSYCPACGDEPFRVDRVVGLIYIVKNDNQRGVKIGKTTKSVEERIKRLSSTGVPGDFYPVAIFPSSDPSRHEKKVHEKLKRYRIEKEHFDLESIEAVLKVYRTLNKRIAPIFYDDELRKTFDLELERARVEMELKLRGKKGR